MKKLLITLLSVWIAVNLVGCSKNHQEKTAEELLVKMVTYSTYTDLEKNEDEIPIILESYFSEEGYKEFVNLKMGYVYSEFFRLSGAESTKQIHIKQMKKVNQKEGVQIKYKLEYIVVYKDEQVKMEDQVSIKVDKKNQVTELIILNSSDIIEKMFFRVRII